MITGINQSKTSTNHISWECKYKFKETKCQIKKSAQQSNNDKCQCACKKHMSKSENGKYLANIMDDSAITCDKVNKSFDE